jgi:hypothetical protein
MKSNGRITFIQPPNPLLLSNITFKSYDNALSGNQEKTPMSNAFFSEENQQILQNALRAGVFRLSKDQFVIAQQSPDELKIVMRAMYLQYATNQPTNIATQIQTLNNYVVAFCVPKLYSEALQYIGYIADASRLPVPLSNPKECKTYQQLELTLRT